MTNYGLGAQRHNLALSEGLRRAANPSKYGCGILSEQKSNLKRAFREEDESPDVPVMQHMHVHKVEKPEDEPEDEDDVKLPPPIDESRRYGSPMVRRIR